MPGGLAGVLCLSLGSGPLAGGIVGRVHRDDRRPQVKTGAAQVGCADVGSADVEPGLRFADLLRQLRTEARLTQEELAEQAELSPRSVSDLERGINRTARKDSALMLASALKLTGPVQEAFVAAARGRAEPARVLAVRSEAAPEASAAAATRTLPRDIGGFTGRERELTGLEKSLAKRAGAERGIDAATAPNGG